MPYRFGSGSPVTVTPHGGYAKHGARGGAVWVSAGRPGIPVDCPGGGTTVLRTKIRRDKGESSGSAIVKCAPFAHTAARCRSAVPPHIHCSQRASDTYRSLTMRALRSCYVCTAVVTVFFL